MFSVYYLFLIALGVPALSVPTVEIPDGKIAGEIDLTHGGKEYMKFIGIPYAKPPIGNLRWTDPQPVSPWMGTYIANFSTSCLQINHWHDPEGGATAGQEDCLYLQVFVPGNEIAPNSNLDVMVHFHSGGFNFASGQTYAGPKYFLDRNLILVTMNFRLGIFGFLSSGDEALPGNFGMKDQVMALRWIKRNIAYFGGNPDSVTLTGLSAGGASTHYHYFSPMSKGLFHRGISASGCALDVWAMQEKPLDKARKVARAVGCDFEETDEMVWCMKERSDKQLVEAARLLRTWLYNPFTPVAPVVDSWSENPFLPVHPYKMLLDGKANTVPWMTGVTTSEGLYNGADFAVKDNYLPDLETHWNEYIPAILHYQDTVPADLMDKVSQTIKKHYLGGKPLSKDTYKELIQLMSDRLFVVDAEEAARLQSQNSIVYFYQFDYTGDTVDTFAEYYSGSNVKYGVCHGDDIMFIFNNPAKELPTFSERDARMSEFLLDMWTSFVKNGNPNVEDWTPLNKEVGKEIHYLYIGSADKIEMRKLAEFGHKSFWDSLPFEENSRLFNRIQKEEL